MIKRDQVVIVGGQPIPVLQPGVEKCPKCQGRGEVLVSLDDPQFGNRAARRRAKKQGYKAGRVDCPECKSEEGE